MSQENRSGGAGWGNTGQDAPIGKIEFLQGFDKSAVCNPRYEGKRKLIPRYYSGCTGFREPSRKRRKRL